MNSSVAGLIVKTAVIVLVSAAAVIAIVAWTQSFQAQPVGTGAIKIIMLPAGQEFKAPNGDGLNGRLDVVGTINQKSVAFVLGDISQSSTSLTVKNLAAGTYKVTVAVPGLAIKNLLCGSQDAQATVVTGSVSNCVAYLFTPQIAFAAEKYLPGTIVKPVAGDCKPCMAGDGACMVGTNSGGESSCSCYKEINGKLVTNGILCGEITSNLPKPGEVCGEVIQQTKPIVAKICKYGPCSDGQKCDTNVYLPNSKLNPNFCKCPPPKPLPVAPPGKPCGKLITDPNDPKSFVCKQSIICSSGYICNDKTCVCSKILAIKPVLEGVNPAPLVQGFVPVSCGSYNSNGKPSQKCTITVDCLKSEFKPAGIDNASVRCLEDYAYTPLDLGIKPVEKEEGKPLDIQHCICGYSKDGEVYAFNQNTSKK